MASVFDDFVGYDVGTGYDTDQYWTLNLACWKQLLPVLEDEFEDATLLDVHTLLYVYHKATSLDTPMTDGSNTSA